MIRCTNKRIVTFVITGIILIILGLILNEWLLAILMGDDGQLSGQNRLIVWSCDIVCVSLGLYFIISRNKPYALINLALLTSITCICFGCCQWYAHLSREFQF